MGEQWDSSSKPADMTGGSIEGGYFGVAMTKISRLLYEIFRSKS
jgi:hypothetical protein